MQVKKFDNFDHLLEIEIRNMYSCGLGADFEKVNREHLENCLDCRMLQVRIRDEYSMDPAMIDPLRAAPVKFSMLHNKSKKPIIKRLNKEFYGSYVKRILFADCRLAAAVIAEVAFVNGSRSAGSLYINAGRMHHEIIDELENNYYLDQIVRQSKNDLDVQLLADLQKVPLLSAVHSTSNFVAVCSDNDKYLSGLVLVYNSRDFCEYLRNEFKANTC